MSKVTFDIMQILPYALFAVSEVIGLSPTRTTGIIDVIIKGLQAALRKPTVQENIDIATGNQTTVRSINVSGEQQGRGSELSSVAVVEP